MTLRRFQQIDVFASGPLNGNPLAVVHGAQGLSDAQMADLEASAHALAGRVDPGALRGDRAQGGRARPAASCGDTLCLRLRPCPHRTAPCRP
jgi:hypothetical protein